MQAKESMHDVSQQDSQHLEMRTIDGLQGWGGTDWRELLQYRDMFFFLVWRDVRVRYAQSVLGIGWAVIQPVVSMIIFTVIFGNFVQVSSDGVPYAIFNYTAMVPWVYFSTSLTDATSSLTRQMNMLTKIYFPRLILPLTPILGKLIDFGIALSLVFLMMPFFGVAPTSGIIFMPLLIMMMMLSAAGIGMLLTSLAVQYRDVAYAMAFVTQLLLYASPVVYSTREVPENLQPFYALNPMVGVIEGFRSALLGTGDMPWDWIAIGAISSTVFFVIGLTYFQRMERIFADVA